MSHRSLTKPLQDLKDRVEKLCPLYGDDVTVSDPIAPIKTQDGTDLVLVYKNKKYLFWIPVPKS
jgi:hypothetical protein